MYKISEFSNITQLSIKALRYYDEEGLLVPSQRNEQQHRLYSDCLLYTSVFFTEVEAQQHYGTGHSLPTCCCG